MLVVLNFVRFFEMDCLRCGGKGEARGVGYMLSACPDCAVKSVATVHKIDRKSVAYKTAIRDIMDTDAKITRQDAVKMFDEAYSKG